MVCKVELESSHHRVCSGSWSSGMQQLRGQVPPKAMVAFEYVYEHMYTLYLSLTVQIFFYSVQQQYFLR
jgi:hypothetical protein